MPCGCCEVVGILTGASILAPFLLSELLTEVIVPLAGTVLTVFVVFAESEARSRCLRVLLVRERARNVRAEGSLRTVITTDRLQRLKAAEFR